MNKKFFVVGALAILVTIVFVILFNFSSLFNPVIEKKTGVFVKTEVLSASPDEKYTNSSKNGSEYVIELDKIKEGWIVDTYNGMCTFVCEVDGEYMCAQYLQMHHLDTDNLTEEQLKDSVQEDSSIYDNLDKTMRSDLNFKTRRKIGIVSWLVVMVVFSFFGALIRSKSRMS